jgi:hypothetical protein
MFDPRQPLPSPSKQQQKLQQTAQKTLEAAAAAAAVAASRAPGLKKQQGLKSVRRHPQVRLDASTEQLAKCWLSYLKDRRPRSLDS